ncbi:MAG: hypothetical protein U1E33_02555 [Rhodospirillales bacterium]
MHQSNSTSPASRAAAVLVQSHGSGSAGEAADRAEERFANIDLGGFGFWKSVERLIRQQRPAP